MKSLSIGLLVLVAAGAAAALSMFAASHLGAPRAEVERSAPVALARDVAPAPVRPARSPAIDDAMKKLDLVRPSRATLVEDFTLPTPDGKSFRLSAHRGKIVFVNFWATWCLPCLEEMPAMERLYRARKDRGLVVVAVSVDSNPALVPKFVKDHRFTFPVVVDQKMQVATSYGVRALPSSFIVDRDGRLGALALGARAWDDPAAHALVDGLVDGRVDGRVDGMTD
jgi:peroxiredoxin